MLTGHIAWIVLCTPIFYDMGLPYHRLSTMKTTIEIADPLLQAARKAARREGTTVRALVERGLRRILAEQRQTRTFQLRDASVEGRGLIPGAEGLSWEALRDLVYSNRGGTE